MKPILFVIGFVAFGIGVVGIWLPVLPTTPFLLLAGVCLAKSSARGQAMLERSKAYQQAKGAFSKEGMKRVEKRHTCLRITLLFGLAFYFMQDSFVMCMVLAVVWLCHVIFLFGICKTRD